MLLRVLVFLLTFFFVSKQLNTSETYPSYCHMLHYILIFTCEEQGDGSLTTEGSSDTCSCSTMLNLIS